ncbi:MAG: PAS domain S-box protein [Flavobacteriales bacterium]|nr:MAG: PAS domain S-box protein [Flavobacteriales bacterium]
MEELHNQQTTVAKLQAQIDELSDFVENAALPLHKVDKNGIIIWANQAELDAMGYMREEYIGRKISDFHLDKDVIEDILQRLISNEVVNNYPARLGCKNGSVKHVLISSSVYRKNGEFMHTRCFTRDVSAMVIEAERKSALLSQWEETELVAKIAKDIIASLNDAIISKDLNGIVTSWNLAAEKTFGYTKAEIVGKPLAVLMPIDRLHEERLIFERLRNGEDVTHFETKRVTKRR